MHLFSTQLSVFTIHHCLHSHRPFPKFIQTSITIIKNRNEKTSASVDNENTSCISNVVKSIHISEIVIFIILFEKNERKSMK